MCKGPLLLNPLGTDTVDLFSDIQVHSVGSMILRWMPFLSKQVTNPVKQDRRVDKKWISND